MLFTFLPISSITLESWKNFIILRVMFLREISLPIFPKHTMKLPNRREIHRRRRETEQKAFIGTQNYIFIKKSSDSV